MKIGAHVRGGGASLDRGELFAVVIMHHFIIMLNLHLSPPRYLVKHLEAELLINVVT